MSAAHALPEVFAVSWGDGDDRGARREVHLLQLTRSGTSPSYQCRNAQGRILARSRLYEGGMSALAEGVLAIVAAQGSEVWRDAVTLMRSEVSRRHFHRWTEVADYFGKEWSLAVVPLASVLGEWANLAFGDGDA